MEPQKRTKGDDNINRSEMNESLRNQFTLPSRGMQLFSRLKRSCMQRILRHSLLSSNHHQEGCLSKIEMHGVQYLS